jgi:hypothetical protein
MIPFLFYQDLSFLWLRRALQSNEGGYWLMDSSGRSIGSSWCPNKVLLGECLVRLKMGRVSDPHPM